MSREGARYAARVSDGQLRPWLARGREDRAADRNTAHNGFLDDIEAAEAEALAQVESDLFNP